MCVWAIKSTGIISVLPLICGLATSPVLTRTAEKSNYYYIYLLYVDKVRNKQL